MKKFYCLITVIAALATGITGCVEAGDFDADTISLSALHPRYQLPLIQHTVSLGDNENVAYDGIGDTAVFFFNIKNVNFNRKWFSLPDQNSGGFSLPYTLMAGNNVDATLPTISIPLTFTDAGQRLDSAAFNSITIRMQFGEALPVSLETLQLWFPQVTGTPATYTATKTTTPAISSLVHTFTINNCKIKPTAGNMLEAKIHIQGTVAGLPGETKQVKLDNLKISGFDTYQRIFGNFGQLSATVTDSVEINFLDNFNIDESATLDFGALKLAAGLQNSMGIPLQLQVSKMEQIDKDGTSTVKTNVAAMDIYAPSYGDQNKTAVTRDTLKLGDLNSSVRKIKFTFDMKSNFPIVSPVNNFLLDTSTLRASNPNIRIPLLLEAKGLVLTDTIDLDISAVSFKELTLRTIIKNRMPAELKLQVTLLDENEQPFPGISTIFETPLIIDAPPVVNGNAQGVETLDKNIVIKPALLAHMKNSRRAIVTIEVNTAGAGRVQFYKSSTIGIQMGATTTLTYDDLLK